MRSLFLVTASLLLAPVVHAQVPAAPEQSAPRALLPDDVQPRAYRLDLTIDPAQERFSGHVEVDAVLAGPSDRIVMHGRELVMRQAVAIVAGRRLAGTWRQTDPLGRAELSFAEPLPAGAVTLAFDYDAPFYNGPEGLFRAQVGNDWYSWSQLQSIDARAVFPSFDQPSFKTPFNVTIRTPPGLMAVSNASELTKTSEGGRDVHRFAATRPLPTYLVALMVGPFASVGGEVAATPQREKPLPLRVISPAPNAAKLDFALQGSKEIVALLEDYFADAFPYPKLDQITSPVMRGAMENAGADLYRDNIIVLDARAPVSQQRSFGMIVAHELAHQWFGDLVTPAWWDDIWLNESFANWMGYRIGHQWRPDLNIGAGALAEGFEAMDTDALVAGRPIRQRIDSDDQINAAFDSITYGKGGHVVAMIAAFMGDARFKEGVRRYMRAHRDGNATSTQFFAAMAEAAGDPRIVPAMRSFTDQQGVPLLTFAKTEGGYRVTQSRYAPLGASPAPARWGVPMCLRRGAARQCSLLTDEQAEVSIAGEGPLMPNAEGTGYYRFELPDEDWQALIAAADRLPGGEAQAAADSLAASVRAGRSDISGLARLAERLAHNPDSYASGAAVDALTGLVWAGVTDGGARKGLRRFVERLYEPQLDSLGLDLRAGAYASEDPERTQRRAQAVGKLALVAKHKPTRERLRSAARAFLAGDRAGLDPQWYGPAFSIHVAQGGREAAKTLLDAALGSDDPVFRPAALNAVSGSGSEKVARWLLDDFRDPRLRASEQRGFISGVMGSGGTREFGYRWARAHLDELLKGEGGIFYAARFPQLFGGFCSVERADELARELRPRFAGKSGALELERAIERVRNCGVLKQQRGPAMVKALRKL